MHLRRLASPLIHTLAILWSATLLFITWQLLWPLSFSDHPASALYLAPWLLGLCGVLGLLLSLRRSEDKSSLLLRCEALLLGLGCIGVLVLIVLAGMITGSMILSTVGVPLLPQLMLPALFMMSLLLVAALGVHRMLQARRAWRSLPPPARQWPALLSLALLPLLLCGVRVVGQEAVMAWYGFNLPARIELAAQRRAGAAAYCILYPRDLASFSELDTRATLLKALEQRYGWRQYPDPHFGIQVEDREYWWSFRADDFITLPAYRLGTGCTRTMP